jgi:hypothetical protein
MQIISADRIGFELIQEPYFCQNKLLGIPKDVEHSPQEYGKPGKP